MDWALGRIGRQLALAAGLIVSTALAGQAQNLGPSQSVTRDEALVLARAALNAGDDLVANQIARRILALDPEDPFALLIIAATGPDLGEARIARMSGGAAWRHGRHLPPALRYEIARHTARAAMVEGRPAFAEVWLRRAIDAAPNATGRARSQADLASLRASRPVGLRVTGNLTPSSNLNSGAGGAQFLIDGIHPVGPISSTGQQLAGLRLSLTADLTFRAIQRAASRTEFGLSLQTNHHWLTPAAQAKIDNDPMLVGRGRFTGADLDTTSVNARLRHSLAVKGARAPIHLDLTASQSWTIAAAGQLSLGLATTLLLWTGEAARLELGFNLRRQWNISGAAPTDQLGATLGGLARLGPGLLNFSLSASQQRRAGDVNLSFDQVQAELGYALDQTGPLRLGGNLFVHGRDQDDYRLGPVAVTRGRHDRRIGLSMQVGFPDMTLMGLEPTLSISAQKGFSNLSRFANSEFAIGLGLAARF